MTNGEAPIDILPYYDLRWPTLFDEERVLLQAPFALWLTGSTEHIGSTAVRLMAAKPVIDIMGRVSSFRSSRPAIEAATGLGHFAYRPDVEHWLCKPSPAPRTPITSDAGRRSAGFGLLRLESI